MDLASEAGEKLRSVADWLSVPSHREAARACILEVLSEVEPEEVAVVIGYIDPFMECAAHGELVSVDSSEEAGRFGGGDWAVLVVVPLVVAILSDLLAKRRRASRERATRPPLDDSEIAGAVSPELIRSVARAVGSRLSRRRVFVLRVALVKGIAELLADVSASEG